MTREDALKEIELAKKENRRADLEDVDLRYVDLRYADLRRANLYGADLEDADLSGANLEGADLKGANLKGADLYGAYLFCADLSNADLEGANLSSANLYGANLNNADLRRANLNNADLSCANLSGANLPNFQICPESGSFIAYKKVIDSHSNQYIAKILITTKAKRTNSLKSRKCRASECKVKGFYNCKGKKINVKKHVKLTGTHYKDINYNTKDLIKSEYDDDIREECTLGLHFFITFKEAKEW